MTETGEGIVGGRRQETTDLPSTFWRETWPASAKTWNKEVTGSRGLCCEQSGLPSSVKKGRARRFPHHPLGDGAQNTLPGPARHLLLCRWWVWRQDCTVAIRLAPSSICPWWGGKKAFYKEPPCKQRDIRTQVTSARTKEAPS